MFFRMCKIHIMWMQFRYSFESLLSSWPDRGVFSVYFVEWHEFSIDFFSVIGFTRLRNHVEQKILRYREC